MRPKLFSRSILLLSLVFILPVVSTAQRGEKPKSQELTQKQLSELDRRAKMKAPSGAGFYIAPIAEIPGRYSLVLTDQDGRHVSESFAESQIVIFEAIMVEAGKFARTDESVGTKKPVITRFYDKKEPAFLVDVAKLRDHSQFFVTIKSLTGHLTVDAGTLRRGGEEKTSTLFTTILSKVQGRNSPAIQ
jgi:hypothetical protein